MKLNPYLVRGYVLLAGDLCRLAWWALMVASLITNYAMSGRRGNEKLREPLSPAQWQVGLHTA